MNQNNNTRYGYFALILALLFLLPGCSTDIPNDDLAISGDQDETGQELDTAKADVISVEVSGIPNEYIFFVEISSSDLGCDQYADWWEILTENEELIYRRILTHSHVNEQPFVRSGGPIDLEPDTVVIVRAHMRPGGYGGKAMIGSIQSGFEEVELLPNFADDVEQESPQPTGCAF